MSKHDELSRETSNSILDYQLSYCTFMACAEKTLDRDRYQAPEEALAFGLIDQVIERRPEPPPST